MRDDQEPVRIWGQGGVRAMKFGMAQETTDEILEGGAAATGQSLTQVAERLLDKNPMGDEFDRDEFLQSLAAMEDDAPEAAAELLSLIETAMSYLRVKVVRGARYDVQYSPRSGIRVVLPNIEGKFCASDPPPEEADAS